MTGQGLVCAAVLIVVVVGQVHAAPSDVNAGQLVDRLKELLHERSENTGGPGLTRDVGLSFCNVHNYSFSCNL